MDEKLVLLNPEFCDILLFFFEILNDLVHNVQTLWRVTVLNLPPDYCRTSWENPVF